MSIGGQTCIKITTRPLLCVDFSYPTSDLGRNIRLNNSNLNMTIIKDRALSVVACQPVEVFSVFFIISKVLQWLLLNKCSTDTLMLIPIPVQTFIPLLGKVLYQYRFWYQKTANTDTRRMPIQIKEEYMKILSAFYWHQYLDKKSSRYPYWALIQTPISEDTNTDVFWYQLNTTLNETTKQSCMYSSSLIL